MDIFFMICILSTVIELISGTTSTNSSTQPRLTISAERYLLNKLLADYHSLGVIGRPVTNTSQSVDVQFGLGLIQMDIEEKDNIMVMSAWTRYSWRDEYLRWDPADYDGVETIKLPSDLIWNPDIMLYNTASTTVYTRTALAVVTYEGQVTWFPHRIFESSCSVNVRFFPFDNQTCHLYFGSWTHTVREINVSLIFPSGIDLSTLDAEYNASSKWEIVSVEATRIMPDQNYALLSFTLCLNRKMMFSSYILTVPAVFLSFLTLVVFALPAEDVEKSQLGLAIFGSLLLLLLIVLEAAPPTASAVPLLGVFYCFTTVIVILSVFLTALVVKISNAASWGKMRPVPKLLKLIVVKGLGTVLCAKQDSYPSKHHLSEEYRTINNTVNGIPARSCMRQHPHKTTSLHTTGGSIECKLTNSFYENILDQLDNIEMTLSCMSHRQRTNIVTAERDRATQREWRHVASIMDRLFFLLYLIAIILSIVFLFPWV